jgi:hypothetical protein
MHHRPSLTGFRDDSFFWEVETDVKGYVGLTKRVLMFQTMAAGVVKNRVFQTAAQRMGATREQFKEVEGMLHDGTRVEIIRNMTAKEAVDGGRTWWDRFKDGFKKA